MTWLRWLRAIALLPGMALVVLPGLLWWLTPALGLVDRPAPAFGPRWVVALVLFAPSCALSLWAMSMFLRFGGGGTPAPWDPPRRLVVRGPYRHVRNPMLSGVIGMLAALALFIGSLPIGVWAVVFLVGNDIYFARSEEPGLRRRFGEEYVAYCAAVRRWLPRLTAWRAR